MSSSDEKSDKKVAPSISSSSSPELTELVGEYSEKRLVRKLDWHILPLISVLHLLSFLDRSNFGNAKAAGMEKSLHLGDMDFNTAAALFYVFYAAFEVPSNVLMKRIGPARWYPIQVIAWGIVCTMISLTQNFTGLCLVRVFLGITEAGLFPGFGYYISLWYKRKELAWRVAIFYASTTSAGAFGGILTYGIIKMDGVGGLVGWRWIFILEGIFTCLMGVYAFWGMVGLPEDAKFLNEQERKQVLTRLAIDREGQNTHYAWEFVVQGFADWKSYLFAIIYMGNTIPVYALSLFLPSIISGLGYTDANAQLLSTPPYILAMCVALLMAWISDKKGVRGPCAIFSQILAIIGFAILLGTKKAKYGYLGTFFTCTGTYATVPNLIAWASNNTGGDTKKGVRIALMVGLGNLGGIVSSFVYRNQDKKTGYKLGHKVMLGALCMSWTGVWVAMYTFNRINKKKEEQCKREGIDASRAHEFVNMGDDSPLFRYTI